MATSDSRRRSVMPGPDRMRTGIPMPAPVFKKPEPILKSSLRQSMAGPPMRGPLLALPTNQMPGPSSNPRHSIYRSTVLAPTSVMMSASKKSGFTVGKDPREMRERAFQDGVRRLLISFLRDHNFPGDVTHKSLASLSAKDFQTIFKFLVIFLDPGCVFGKDSRKFEDEVIPVLKGLKYPFVAPLKPTVFQTPGGMQNLPLVLGILHWLVLSCTLKYEYIASGDPTLQDPTSVPESFAGEMQIRAVELEYIDGAYGAFLAGQDAFDAEDQGLRDRYARRDQTLLDESKRLKDERDALASEYQRLTSAPSPVEALKAEYALKLRDTAKFHKMIENQESKIKRYTADVHLAQDHIAQDVREMEQLRAEQAELEGVVKAQNISPEEAASMRQERDLLTRAVEEMKRKVEETRSAYMSLEVKWAKDSDRLELAVDEYTVLTIKLELDPAPCPPFPRPDFFSLALDLAQPRDLVRSAGLKSTVKPALADIAEQKRQNRSEVADLQLTVEHELDKLGAQCDTLEEEITRVEARVASVLEEADKVRETAQAETHASDAEAAKLDKDIANARAAAKSYGIGIKSRLHALQIARQEQIQQTDRLREETVKAITKNTEEILKFKSMMSECLDDLCLYAEAN